MIDFTSEDGIMDAIDKFFHLSQEEKDNYNKSLKVDKANTLRFLYMFHEVFKLRDFGFNVENTTNELFKTGGVESTLCKATLCSCKEMIFDDKELTILSKSLKFCDKTNISLDFVDKTIIFNLIVNNAKTQEDLSYTDLVHYDAEVFDDDRSIFYDLREKTEVFYPDKDYDEQKLFAVANFIKMLNYDFDNEFAFGSVDVKVGKGLILNAKVNSIDVDSPRRIEVFRQLLEYSESFKIEACEDNDCRFEFEIKELM